ncbi:hypothetical protein LCGC14_0404010 [marine sediment metagenome]|uniref:Uncharacterized protein n=1 Tax=marine sediment metagenome TaxID=412755 RepID=A0A0F9TDU8_9ZZZZ
MPNKKYDFYKILAEYNKLNGTKYFISPKITAPRITYFETDIFSVTYSQKGYSLSRKKSLYDFTYYHIKPSRESLSRCIANMIRAKEDAKLTTELKILPSNKIRYAYLRTNYFSGGGILGGSCMRSKENQKSLNFYIKNNVRIVVITDNNNKIHARALLWGDVKSTEHKDTFTFTYLDRVYARSDSFITQFYDLAKKNKWKHYASTSAGKARGSHYIDNINLKGICHLPYTDTFRYLYYKDSLIGASTSSAITKRVKDKDFCITLTHTTEGGYVPALDPDRVQEVLTHNHISKKDAVRVKRYNGYVLKKNIVNINGDYYSKYDKALVESKIDGFLLKENSVNEYFSNELIDKTKAVYSEKHKGYIHKTNVVNIKDEIYHTKDSDIICFNGKWYHISECFINYNREAVNRELTKRPLLSDIDLPDSYIRSQTIIQSVAPGAVVTREGNLIPKEHAVIAYNLIHNSFANNLEYQEVYRTNGVGLIKLITGELIVDSSNNRQYIKRFNGKWYIKQEFEAPNKKQLQFSFMGK